jgi:D-alanyl-D-alanine carboxypeptidase
LVSKEDISIRVTRSAANMNGTSGNLLDMHYIKLIDLLYALMLPSGNDAAYLLA